MSQVSITRLNGESSSGRLDKRAGRLRSMMEYSREPSAVLIPVKTEDYSLGLGFFFTSLYATILEDTITEIRILNECNSELRIMKTMADILELRAKKFSVTKPTYIDELSGIDEKNLGKEKYKLDKLASDRNILIDTILKTYTELSLRKNYQPLVDRNNMILNRDMKYAALIAEETKNRISRRDLAKQLRVQRNHITSATYDVNAIVEDLKAQVEDGNLNSEVRGRYITNWERARTEQHMQKIYDKEAPPYNNVVVNKQKLDNEQRVHSEVMLLVHLAINDTMEKVENIMNKYDADIEAIDLKIQIMKNNHQTAQAKRMKLEALYEDHEKEINNWVHFKTEREKARQYHLKMTNAAVTAQAWWRGLMVRLQLGPFKPKGRRPPPTPKPKEKKK